MLERMGRAQAWRTDAGVTEVCRCRAATHAASDGETLQLWKPSGAVRAPLPHFVSGLRYCAAGLWRGGEKRGEQVSRVGWLVLYSETGRSASWVVARTICSRPRSSRRLQTESVSGRRGTGHPEDCSETGIALACAWPGRGPGGRERAAEGLMRGRSGGREARVWYGSGEGDHQGAVHDTRMVTTTK
jgi:hypothetical protein